MHYLTARFAEQCAAHAENVALAVSRHGPATEPEPERLHVSGIDSHRGGPVGLLRDLQDLYQLANLVDSTWTMIRQAAQGARDHDLIHTADECMPQITAQLSWLCTRMKVAAPQTLLVAP